MLVLVVLFLLVFCARGWVIMAFGSSMPYWDQWGGESGLLVDAADGGVGLGALFAPHNEHRLVVSKLVWLGVFHLNGGQWDNVPTLFALALLAAGACAAVTGAVGASLSWRHGAVLVLAGALLFALPVSWLNSVWGFQAQFPAQVLLTVVCLFGLGTRREGGALWWIGLLAGVGCVLTSGSGFLVAPALLLVLGIEAWRTRSAAGLRGPTALAACGILAAGVVSLLAGPDVPNRFAAESPGAFAVALLRNMAWPWAGSPWAGPLVQLPIGLLLARHVIGGGGHRREADRFLVLLGAALFAQFLAIAAVRGVQGMAPHDRYYDIHATMLLVNFAAALRLVGDLSPRAGWSRALPRVLFFLWTLAVLHGVLGLSRHHLAERLPAWRERSATQTRNVRAYLATGDPAHIEGKPRLAIPTGDPAELMRTLDDERVRRILPPSLRPTLALDGGEAAGVFAGAMLPVSVGAPPEGPLVFSSFAEEGGVGEFRGRPVEAGLPWLTAWMAGHQPGGHLRIGIEADGGGGIHWIDFPDRRLSPDERGWRVVRLPVPVDGPFRIVASDRRDHGWFALAGARPSGGVTARLATVGDVFPVATIFLLAVLLSLLITMQPATSHERPPEIP